MDVPLLLCASSSSSRLVCSPFTQNALLFKNRHSCIFPRFRSFRFLTPRNSSATLESSLGKNNLTVPRIFGCDRRLSGIQKVVDVIPSSGRYALSALVVVGALAAGYAIGLRIGGTRATSIGGAVALGLVGGAAVITLNSAVPGAAVVSLHNKVAGCSNLEALKREDIEQVARRYGVSKRNRAFTAELYDLYSRFVMSVLGTGNASLEGDEVDRIIKFKCALGIDDPDAADVHMELGRRIYGQILETGDHDADMEHCLLFRKLVYVSSLVFGEGSVFLLPWKQVLKVADCQVAAHLLREHIRKLVEEKVAAALAVVKSRSRSKYGGKHDGDGKVDDLKLLYRSYLMQAFSNGHIELTALDNLKDIFGLSKSETERIMLEIISVFYIRRLSKAFSQGELERATSKETFLHNLCSELRFDPEEAHKLHKEIYRQKLQLAVADGALCEEDIASLLQLQVLLCIPQKIVDAAHSNICGSAFEKVVRDVITLGIDGSDNDLKAEIRKASQGLRLSRDASMAIVNKTVRKAFMNYVKKSRAAGSGTEAVKELKKMVILNNIVVTELISSIREEFPSDSRRHEEENKSTRMNEEAERESLHMQGKGGLNKKLQAMLGKTGRVKITLAADLSERERCDLYRTYLLHCISREAAVVPFGAQNITRKGDIEYFILNQLGHILGMSSKEIAAIHKSSAKKAIRDKRSNYLSSTGLGC
ncbi:TIC110 protein [Nymphaea thermarum]|nr:TIC110 protein [Nymphaea thermarum]